MLTTQDKARLSWHCRRGMLELDLILSRFLEKGLDLLNTEQIKQFNALLDYTDPELFAWLMGHTEPADKDIAEIVTFVRAHS